MLPLSMEEVGTPSSPDSLGELSTSGSFGSSDKPRPASHHPSRAVQGDTNKRDMSNKTHSSNNPPRIEKLAMTTDPKFGRQNPHPTASRCPIPAHSLGTSDESQQQAACKRMPL